MTHEQRIEGIIQLYNNLVERRGRASKEGDFIEASCYNYVINATKLQIMQSGSRELKEYFNRHAHKYPLNMRG